MASWQWNVGFAFVFVLFVLLAGFFYELIGERRDANRHPAPGRLVSVGDHKLHLLCKGDAAPTVVIEQGAGEASHFWWPVQDQIAEFATVCTYDRAGYGWSEATRAGRTIDDRGEELRTLLANAGIPGPYIFVAHSYGGLIVRASLGIIPPRLQVWYLSTPRKKPLSSNQTFWVLRQGQVDEPRSGDWISIRRTASVTALDPSRPVWVLVRAPCGVRGFV